MAWDKDTVIKWTATAISVAGAVFTSLDFYPLGAVMFLLDAGIWLVVSIRMREVCMITVNGVLLTIYVAGLTYKYFCS